MPSYLAYLEKSGSDGVAARRENVTRLLERAAAFDLERASFFSKGTLCFILFAESKTKMMQIKMKTTIPEYTPIAREHALERAAAFDLERASVFFRKVHRQTHIFILKTKN